MALKVNSTSPTVINVNQGSDFTISFPTGTESVPKLSKIGPDGNTVYYYNTTFEQTYSTTYSKYLQLQINGVFLTSTMQEVYKTGNSLLYNSYRASFSNGVLTLEQYIYKQGTSSSSSKLNLMGSPYTGTFSPNTSLTVLKYATCGSDLEEATRSAVSSYTSTQLDGWVGLQNDTWSGITNASSLIANKYYYIRVYVSDTSKYGKFCVKFKSASGTTITVDNMGWGYDGEVIYSTPVWGKPYSLSVTNNSGTGAVNVVVNRTSSPNQQAGTGTVSAGSNKIYHGDVLNITVTPVSGYKLTTFTINGTSYANSQTSAVTQTITVTSAVTVKCTTEAAASWQTVWTGSQGVAAFIWKTTASGTKTKTLANGTPTGIDWSLPTKITGTASCYNNGIDSQTTATITDLELSDGVSNLLHRKSGYVGNYLVGVSISIQRNASTPNAVVTGSCSKASGANVISGASLTLTEVKQYC